MVYDVSKSIITKSKLRSEEIIVMLLLLFVSAWFLSMYAGRVQNGALDMFVQNETSQEYSQGVIQNIIKMNEHQFPAVGKNYDEYYCDNLNGYIFIIDGEKYYGIAIGELDVGDRVEISYLPKNHYLLTIEIIKDDS